MKIYIFAEPDGISGVCSGGYLNPGAGRTDLRAALREYMAGDINACIEGCFRAGADEVLVRDWYADQTLLSRGQIDPRADIVEGTVQCVPIADLENAGGMILLGCSSAANAEAHAGIAAQQNVPVIMVSGSDKACAEAEKSFPGIVTCPVKKAFSTLGCRMPSLEKTHALITEKTEEAVRKIRK